MKGSEKQVILNASATIKSTIDYIMNVIYQPQKGQLQSRDFCDIVGKKFSCIAQILIGGLQIAEGFFGTVNPYIIAAGIVNSINAISELFSNPSCDCSPTGATCYTLQGISVFRGVNMNCSGNYIKFCTWGDGPSPSSFAWNIAEINEYGEVIQNTSYQIPTSTSCISLTPDANLNKMFRLSITTSGFPNCNNGQQVTKDFDFTWGEIVGNAGTVLIDGPSTGYVGGSSYYYASGTFLTNPKNSFLWVFNLYQGSYVFGNISSGGGNSTSVGINWTGASCGPGAFGNTGYNGCYYLSIGGRSANSCSGSQSWGSTQVAVYNY